jgi:hypothetical protein
VAGLKRRDDMNRTLVTAVSFAALILAVPLFATVTPQSAHPGLVSRTGQVKVVTGEVLFTTPVDIVLRTPSGVQKFEITRHSQILGGTGEGDIVTITYRPEVVAAKAPAVPSASLSVAGQK